MNIKTNNNPNTLTCLVFRTSIQDREELQATSEVLDKHPGIREWSVDLEDWERVLRVECIDLDAGEIVNMLRLNGVKARQMET